MGVVSSTGGRDQERDLPASIVAGAPDYMETEGFFDRFVHYLTLF